MKTSVLALFFALAALAPAQHRPFRRPAPQPAQGQAWLTPAGPWLICKTHPALGDLCGIYEFGATQYPKGEEPDLIGLYASSEDTTEFSITVVGIDEDGETRVYSGVIPRAVGEQETVAVIYAGMAQAVSIEVEER